MSRFFRRAGESDSSSGSDDSEIEELGVDQPAPSTSTRTASGFARRGSGSESSSSSSEASGASEKKSASESEDESEDDAVKRVPLRAIDKRMHLMETIGAAMENAQKINDWVAISNEFDKFTRIVQRQHNVAEPAAPLYISTLLDLENSLTNAVAKEKEAKKKMNATNARALTAVKSRVKKAVKEYEKDIKRYQTDPEAFKREYTALVSPDVPVRVTKPTKKDMDEGDDDDVYTTVGKGGKAIQFTTEAIFKNLQQVQEARGKKNTDRAEQIRILEKLLEVAVTPYQRIRVLLALISSRFDYNSSVATYMPIELWLSAQAEIDQLVAVVASDSSYSVQEITLDYDELAERTPETEKDGVVRIRGSIISFVDRLDDEFTKSLQSIDPHGNEYVDRLKDEKVLYCTICRAQAFYEQIKEREPLSRVIIRRLEHIYCKPDAVVQALEAAVSSSELKPQFTLSTQATTSGLIHGLCTHLYKSGSSLLRTRAMLCHIYHHALHNDFFSARDMLLMSHLQESIHSADVATQILYNRTVVQLGLCAFRCGLIREAQATLQEIFTTQRVKELLAQGMHQQRFQTLTPEQEKTERQRQLPFHMHINTELLEAAFLVSSMLVEIPLLASIDSEEQKRKAISKPFRRLLDFADRQVFSGPPESTRDHIMQASKALQDGEWELCRDLVQSIKIWSLMPEAAAVKEMLAKRIQEQGLRTYLFTYAPHYSTLSLALLARTFSLPLRTVTSVVSKMIWNDELSASLDQAAAVVVFHRVDLSHMQQLALLVADKVAVMVEQNEKAVDGKLGGGNSGWADRGETAKGEKRGEQLQERRGRSERGKTSTSRGTGNRGRGTRFAQGLGNQMGHALQRAR